MQGNTLLVSLLIEGSLRGKRFAYIWKKERAGATGMAAMLLVHLVLAVLEGELGSKVWCFNLAVDLCEQLLDGFTAS